MTPGKPSDSPCTIRMPVFAASSNPARAAYARSTRCSKNGVPIPWSASNDQTRARSFQLPLAKHRIPLLAGVAALAGAITQEVKK